MGSVALTRVAKFAEAIIDGKDPALAEHQGRTSATAQRFATSIGCSEVETESLVLGLSLHDFGKLLIPDSILQKPGRLSSAELSLVQRHPELGHGLLEPLGLDSRVNAIVLHHHENYDGSGYPAQLRGEDIPLLARAARILDSFDALTEDRPYHRGRSPAAALETLERDARMYDPGLLAAFREIAEDVPPPEAYA